jgi:hypothetical protein
LEVKLDVSRDVGLVLEFGPTFRSPARPEQVMEVRHEARERRRAGLERCELSRSAAHLLELGTLEVVGCPDPRRARPSAVVSIVVHRVAPRTREGSVEPGGIDRRTTLAPSDGRRHTGNP